MAQFKTDLTLAELAVLITNSGLNKGLQYYVTDKDWLLYATSVNTLKPVSGSLHIFNGEILPTGIEPDVLFIDTGVVSNDEVNDISLTSFIGYLLSSAELYSNTAYDDGITVRITDGNVDYILISFDVPASATEMVVKKDVHDISGLHGQLQIPTLFNYLIGNMPTGYRMILEFHHSELSYPIPVPHIVSAETDETGQYANVTFDSEMSITVVDYSSDVTVKINNIQDEVAGFEKQLNNIVRIEFDTFPIYGDIITLSIASGNIKNIWGGLLAAVTDYPVVNNVPEP